MIPKTFIPQKDKADKVTKDLLKPQAPVISHHHLEALADSCEKYLSGVHSYRQAEEIIKSIEYTKHELQLFCDRLVEYQRHEYFSCVGLYLSVLADKIIKEDEEIMLKMPDLKEKISYVGYFWRKGTLIIKGDLEDYIGAHMVGGKLVIKGEILGCNTASYMDGGELHAKRITHISDSYMKGKIYEDGTKLRPLEDDS